MGWEGGWGSKWGIWMGVIRRKGKQYKFVKALLYVHFFMFLLTDVMKIKQKHKTFASGTIGDHAFA